MIYRNAFGNKHKLITTFINILGLVVGEIRSLWSDGLIEYVSDLWNIVDFIQNTFYVIWIGMRLTAWLIVQVRFDYAPLFFL